MTSWGPNFKRIILIAPQLALHRIRPKKGPHKWVHRGSNKNEYILKAAARTVNKTVLYGRENGLEGKGSITTRTHIHREKNDFIQIAAASHRCQISCFSPTKEN